MPRYFLTTAIDYVNSRPHLGTAYEKIAADVMARYKRLAGFDVRFLMGNDEHSQNVFRKAARSGLDPMAYCDQMEQEFRRRGRRLDISFDDFIQTTEPRHQARRDRVRPVDPSTPATSTRASTKAGTASAARRSSRRRISSTAVCPLHPQTDAAVDQGGELLLPAVRSTSGRLLAHYAAHPEFIQPESRRNEILRLIEAGLEDISVSRAGQAWGIPLPFDPRSVVYVWFDALINYTSAVGLGTDDRRCSSVVAGRSARHRQGHHALPLPSSGRRC